LNGTFIWRSLFTALLSGLGVIIWSVWVAAVDIRDASQRHTDALLRIENTLIQQWKSLGEHDTRLRVLEARPYSERNR
jgi:hypothetical protein